MGSAVLGIRLGNRGHRGQQVNRESGAPSRSTATTTPDAAKVASTHW
jgi:hypothetical protein